MNRIKSVVPLEVALEYRNDEVIYRFATTYRVAEEEAEEIFLDTKRWLWLAATTKLPQLWMGPSIWIIDEMWHTFILFTADYAAFCERCFGRYLHHCPTPREEKDRVRDLAAVDPERFLAEQTARTRAQYLEINRLLGPAILHKWTIEYAHRFPQADSARPSTTVLQPAAQGVPVAERNLIQGRPEGDESRGEDYVETLLQRTVMATPTKIVPPCTGASCGVGPVFGCVCNSPIPTPGPRPKPGY
jgi:hypothetical protein